MDFLIDVFSQLPGETASQKLQSLSSGLAILGVLISLLIWLRRVVSNKRSDRPVSRRDLDDALPRLMQQIADEVTQRMISREVGRIAVSPTMPAPLREASMSGLQRGVAEAVSAVVALAGAEGSAAKTALEAGDSRLAEDLLEAHSAEQRGASPTKAALALHQKAALASLRDPEAAIDACQRAIAIDPDDPLGWSRLAHLYVRTGNVAAAKSAFDRAIALAPSGERNIEMRRMIDTMPAPSPS